MAATCAGRRLLALRHLPVRKQSSAGHSRFFALALTLCVLRRRHGPARAVGALLTMGFPQVVASGSHRASQPDAAAGAHLASCAVRAATSPEYPEGRSQISSPACSRWRFQAAVPWPRRGALRDRHALQRLGEVGEGDRDGCSVSRQGGDRRRATERPRSGSTVNTPPALVAPVVVTSNCVPADVERR